MTLYHLFQYDRSLKVRWLANELNISLKVVRLNAKEGEYRRAPFTDINPYSLIPTLVTEDKQCLFEAAAICLYLCRQEGKDLVDEDNPMFMQWLFYFASSLDQLSGGIIGLKLFGECEKVRARLEPRIPGKLIAMEQHLEGQDYWYNGQFSLLDIFAWHNLAYLRNDGQLANYPNLNHYIDNLALRPSLTALSVDKLINPS